MMINSREDRPTAEDRAHPLEAGRRHGPRIVFAAALAALALWIARDYVVALVWAVLIAIAVWPLYAWYLARRGAPRQRSASALLFTALTALGLVVPLTIVTVAVGREAGTVAEWLSRAQKSGVAVPEWVAWVPVLGRVTNEWWRSHLETPQEATNLLRGFDLLGRPGL